MHRGTFSCGSGFLYDGGWGAWGSLCCPIRVIVHARVSIKMRKCPLPSRQKTRGGGRPWYTTIPLIFSTPYGSSWKMAMFKLIIARSSTYPYETLAHAGSRSDARCLPRNVVVVCARGFHFQIISLQADPKSSSTTTKVIVSQWLRHYHKLSYLTLDPRRAGTSSLPRLNPW